MLTKDQLTELLTEQGQPAYRATQILDWIYKKRARSWEEMSNLPEPLREVLAEKYPLRPLKHTLTKGSKDTTRKFLLELADGRYVETVLIPASPALMVSGQIDTLCVCPLKSGVLTVVNSVHQGWMVFRETSLLRKLCHKSFWQRSFLARR